MTEIDQETLARIEEAVSELAQMDYPKVWIGELGMTVDEALSDELGNLQARKEAWEEATPEERSEIWANIPEHERGERDQAPESWDELPDSVKEQIRTPFESPLPGETMVVEGGGLAFVYATPQMSADWLDGAFIYQKGLQRLILDPEIDAELFQAVRVIDAAKKGKVPVMESWGLKFMEAHELSEEDILFAKSFTPDGKILVYTVPTYRYVRVEDLTPEDVDEVLLDYLECYASNGPYAMGEFVIEDTEVARQALAWHRGEE